MSIQQSIQIWRYKQNVLSTPKRHPKGSEWFIPPKSWAEGSIPGKRERKCKILWQGKTWHFPGTASVSMWLAGRGLGIEWDVWVEGKSYRIYRPLWTFSVLFQCNERAMEGFRVTWSGWSFKMICETISCLVSGVFYGGVSLGLATGYRSWELRWDMWEKNPSKSIMTTHHVLNHRHWSVLWNTSLKCYCDRTYWHLSLN